MSVGQLRARSGASPAGYLLVRPLLGRALLATRNDLPIERRRFVVAATVLDIFRNSGLNYIRRRAPKTISPKINRPQEAGGQSSKLTDLHHL